MIRLSFSSCKVSLYSLEANFWYINNQVKEMLPLSRNNCRPLQLVGPLKAWKWAICRKYLEIIFWPCKIKEGIKCVTGTNAEQGRITFTKSRSRAAISSASTFRREWKRGQLHSTEKPCRYVRPRGKLYLGSRHSSQQSDSFPERSTAALHFKGKQRWAYVAFSMQDNRPV